MNTRRTTKKSKVNKTTVELSPEQQEQEKNLFPIVGIGASAGGLEAFTQLLSHLPTDTGMGFVLVQHLSPNQKSMLPEILSRTTSMPVNEVREGMKVEPNHVYVIPANVTMTIVKGVLKLNPREKTRGLALTVNDFLISLAEDLGSKAIGVVLSGGNEDGTKGLENIKCAGGITFAQAEEPGMINTMPNTAIASGYVDFILTPQQIAQKLTTVSTHPYIKEVETIPEIEVIPDTTDTLFKIFNILRLATGVNFTYYKQNTLQRRIQRRMMLYRLDKLEDYVYYLQTHPVEVSALYQDVLITVTSFFRDPLSFEALKTQVFPILTKERKSDDPIRLWVAGCSTGEEAYSIAICLIEFLKNQPIINIPIQIFATDINDIAIEKARTGIYKTNQIGGVSPERLQRFFVKVEGGYQITKSVRELCVFARQNLISDPPFSRLDLISCRNVLIYLGAAVQKKIIPTFHYGLKPTGFLMLGISETIGDFSELFSVVDKKYKIYARKLISSRLGIELISMNYALETPKVSTSSPLPNIYRDDLEIQKQADKIVLNEFAPVGVVINDDLEILQFRGQTNSYLEPAPGIPSFNLLKMAKEELRLDLRNCIYQARKGQIPVTRAGIEIRTKNAVRLIKIDVIPFSINSEEVKNTFLVLFSELSSVVTSATAPTSDIQPKQAEKNNHKEEIVALQQELKNNKDYLQSVIEEQQASNQDLRAANEEILSSNEELQSTNEELQTAKEEIQATNEELNTINDELQRRNFESNRVNNDLQNLLTNINISVLILSSDLQIRRFTPMAGSIFNLIPSDMGRPFSNIKHKLNIPDLETQVLEVIRTLNFKTQEVQDQNGHWYDLRIRPYRTLDDKIDGAVVVVVDIDELKHGADQLIASRDYSEAIVDTVRQSLVVLDIDLRVVTANQFFYDTFRVVREATENCLIYEIGNGQWNIAKLRSLLEEVLPQQNQFQDVEVEHNFEEIGSKVMLLNARQMPQIGDKTLILLVIEDITQEKQFEAERVQLLEQEQSARNAAETANRAKDEFLSILSHELRNPLSSLIGWTQLLRKKQLDETKTNQALEAIERAAQAQNLLIGDLLDISRISAGRLNLDIQPVQLVAVISAAIEVVNLAAEAKNIEIVLDLDPTSKTLPGDPIRLQQIVWNLLSNAIKFTPTGGRIDLTLKYSDFQAEIQVRDTGMGISADFLPYVFDRFRQADGTTSKSNPGLGLGLAIVRHLVELHGGTIAATSPGEGQGTTFTIRLPIQRDPEPTVEESNIAIEPVPTPPTAPAEYPSLSGVRVLMVDDEPDIRQLFHIILEDHGVEVTSATSAQEALSILKANPGGYDILLSDIGLPHENGYALMRQVRALSVEEGGQIPAAALSGYTGEIDQANSLSAGFQKHLNKPIEPDQLLSVVAELSGRQIN
ncbi:MAG: PAS domain-containing protein [Dolichospermum sp. DET50]|nr:PAS domain-containing protein [Dolichospermum sp. DET66]MBS3033567.1 PAS domain-containing protein [Dolichospermum sp. DET67]MBS3038771.1 PAS domain-containing protein [Dolichospermum sp. DET50]QSX66041.1 MAG: PAS domain-containing protein [Dolichospermum sp. DET69]